MRPILGHPSVLALARHLGMREATLYSRIEALESRGLPVTLESVSTRRPPSAHAPQSIRVMLADGRVMPSIKDAAAAIGVQWKTARAWVAKGRPLAPRVESVPLTRIVKERGEVPYFTVLSRLRVGVPLEEALRRRERKAYQPRAPKRDRVADWPPGQRRARAILCAWAARH